ncbi:hypothetical protein [Campylobacter sp. LR196d]|nr:hypothetical protein [Campylobacter sp. LR196d]
MNDIEEFKKEWLKLEELNNKTLQEKQNTQINNDILSNENNENESKNNNFHAHTKQK